MLTNRASELIMDVKIHGSLGCSDHVMVEFTVLKNMGQVMKKAFWTLGELISSFFKELVDGMPWKSALWGKGELSWQLLILTCKQSHKEGKIPEWLSKDLLVKLKEGK